jgi:hypothetical protein
MLPIPAPPYDEKYRREPIWQAHADQVRKAIHDQMSNHAIELWTFIVATIGVVAGLAALGFAWRTIREAQKQARDDAKTAKAHRGGHRVFAVKGITFAAARAGLMCQYRSASCLVTTSL